MPHISVILQAPSGHYVSAEGGGGRELRASRTAPLAWENFVLINLHGGPLAHGQSVVLQAASGEYVYADGGGGGRLVAAGPAIGHWEPLIIHRVDGPGPINSGDQVALQAVSGTFVYAEGGGGQGLVAQGPAIGDWERFMLNVLPPRHVRIELYEVLCRDTEDVTGADELFVSASGSNRAGGAPQVALTTPFSINNGQRRSFDPGQSVVFDGDVEVASTLVIGMVAFDEDASHDWADHGEKVRAIASHVATAMAVAGPKGVVAGAVLRALVEGVGLTMALDADDKLGTTAPEFPVIALPWGESMHRWPFWRKRLVGYSTWNYELTYRVFVG